MKKFKKALFEYLIATLVFIALSVIVLAWIYYLSKLSEETNEFIAMKLTPPMVVLISIWLIKEAIRDYNKI
jgi:uncharacterized membrane protein